MKIAISLVLATASLLASNLVEQAAQAGLKPIPASHKELMKLIDNPKSHLQITKNNPQFKLN